MAEERTVREELARSVRDVTTRDRKFRQAGFAYLHVGVLYEAAAWVMAERSWSMIGSHCFNAIRESCPSFKR